MANLQKREGHLTKNKTSGILSRCEDEPPPVCSTICDTCEDSCSDGSSITAVVSGFTLFLYPILNGTYICPFVGPDCRWLGFEPVDPTGVDLGCALGIPPNFWGVDVTHFGFPFFVVTGTLCLVCAGGHPTGTGVISDGFDSGVITIS